MIWRQYPTPVISGCSICGKFGHNKRTCADGVGLRSVARDTISVAKRSWEPTEERRAQFFGSPPTPASVVMGIFKRGAEWP